MNKYSLTDMPNEVKNPTLKCTRARNPSSYAGYGFTGNTVMESNETDCTKPGPMESCSGGPLH